MPGVYTYSVEIDTKTAQAAAKTLRQVFETEMSQIQAAPTSPAATRQATQTARQAETAMKRTAKAAYDLEAATQAAMQALNIDPATADVRELDAAMQELSRTAGETRDNYERLLVNIPGQSREAKAAVNEYYANLERQQGRQAANAARAAGVAESIGAIRSEFGYGDDTKAVDEFTTKTRGEITERQKFSLEQQEELLRLELTLLEQEVAQNRLERSMLERRVDQSAESLAVVDAAANPNQYEALSEEFERNLREIDELQETEALLVRNINNTINEIDRRAEEIARRRLVGTNDAGLRTTASSSQLLEGGADAGTIRQTLSVRKTTATNARATADQFARMASDAEKWAEYIEKGNASLRVETQELVRRSTVQANIRADEAARVAAAKEKGRQDLEAARNATAQEQRRTAVARAEAAERSGIARREAAEAVEQARIARVEIVEEEKRKTLEAREQAKIRAQEAQRQRRSQQLGGLGNFVRPQNILYGLGAAAGLYSIDTALQTFYQQGATGARQIRTAETFDFLAERIEEDSGRILVAMREASQGTISDSAAMALSAQVLAQKFAAGRESISDDLTVLTRAARRFTQVYADENGAFLAVEEVFGRLIKFVREGNKELVDQFGISNQRIAETLGIANEGLRGSEGAVLRWQGVIAILEEELGRLGEATLTEADRIEAAEARITNSANRIRQSLAEPTATVAEFGADAIEALQEGYTAGSDEAGLLGLFKQLESVRADLEIAETAVKSLSEGLRDGSISGQQYADQLERMQEHARSNAAEQARLEQEIANVLATGENVPDWLREMGEELEITGRSMAEITELTASFDRALIGLSSTAAGLDLSAVQGYQAFLSGDLSALTPRQRQGVGAGDPYFGGDPDAPRIGDLNAARREEERKLAEEEQRLAEQTAKKAQQEWESAVESMEKEFEAALKAVPGLFGTSEVTDQQLKDAELGIYTEQADEYLRRLRDEVLNNVEYEDVDIQDAAARLGIDPNLPAEAILSLFEAAWADSSLFADGANLDLINRDAVEAELARQERRKSGEEAIKAYFGLTEEEIGQRVGGAIGREFVATTTGQGEAGAVAEGDVNPYMSQAVMMADGITAGLEEYDWSDLAARTIVAIGSGFSAEEAIEGQKAIGYSFATWVNEGWDEGVSDQVWADSMISAVAAEVLESLAGALNDENGGNGP